MGLCSYVEKRRQRYYFRVRLPADAVAVLGRTHVIGSLLTADARAAKARAARFYFALAGFLAMPRLRMKDETQNSDISGMEASGLVRRAFALGCRYEAEQERLCQRFSAERELLRRNCQAELQALVLAMQTEWAGGAPISEMTLLNRPAPWLDARHAEADIRPVIMDIPAPPASRSPVWHSLRDAFLADKPGLTAKTLWSYNQAFDVWTDLIGNKAIGDIQRADVKRFADHLRDKPNPRGGQLNHQTIQRSLGHIKTFMAWAVAAGHVENDHFGEVRGREQTREERCSADRRRAFTATELVKLFASPLFHGDHSEAERAAAWFLLIAALTGARTEEITGAPAELVRLGEAWCLDLRRVGTKTDAAPRLVPLLPDLIRLGLPAWANRQKAKGRLLVQPGAAPRRAAAWSKYLNRYINKHVCDHPNLVLYSLRHSFRQMLRAANIGDELANKVFGHETGSVGAGYGKDLSVQEADLVIRAVRPPIELEHLTVRN